MIFYIQCVEYFFYTIDWSLCMNFLTSTAWIRHSYNFTENKMKNYTKILMTSENSLRIDSMVFTWRAQTNIGTYWLFLQIFSVQCKLYSFIICVGNVLLKPFLWNNPKKKLRLTLGINCRLNENNRDFITSWFLLFGLNLQLSSQVRLALGLVCLWQIIKTSDPLSDRNSTIIHLKK